MKLIAASIIVLAGAVVMLAGAVSTAGHANYEALIIVGGVIMIGGAALILVAWADKRD